MFPGTWKASKSCRCLVPQTEPASLGWESTPPRPLGSCLHCPALPSPAGSRPVGAACGPRRGAQRLGLSELQTPCW